MQRLTAAPREHLTDAQVSALLNADALEVSAGCDLLDKDLVFQADVSDDLLGGKIARNNYARIHQTCSLQLSRSLSWGTDLLRPFQVLTDTTSGVTARFNLGVFSLISPDREIGETPETYAVEGFDRTYLLDREVGDAYSVDTVPVLQAVRQAFIDAGFPTSQVLLDGSSSSSVLPAPMTWPLLGGDGGPATWLRVVNDLLAAINYRGIYCDENGLFRSEPYAPPVDRAVEWALDADSPTTLLHEDRTVVEDIWKTPNRWIFVQRNLAGDPPPAPVNGAGIFQVDNASTGPTSQLERGVVWPVTVEYDASSQSDLVALGLRRVDADLRRTRELKVSTGPFPVAGHFDVLSYKDAAVDVSVLKTQAAGWSFDLTGDTVEWQLEVVA